MLHNNNKKKMDNLHFIPNNILTKNFKELKKRLSVVFKFYIYTHIYMNYIMHLIVYL